MAINKSSRSAVLYFLACVSALFHCVSADYFTNPSNQYTDLSIHYTLGSTVQVTWDCSLDTITLLVSHWGGNAVGALLSDAQNNGSYAWKIGESDNINDEAISESPNFVLVIRDPTGTVNTSNISGFVDGELQSRGFVIESNNVSSSSSSSTSTSPSSSISSTSSFTSSTATTTSSSHLTTVPSSVISPSTPTPTESHGLSTGAKVGIGLGAGLGSLLLLGLGIFAGIIWMRRSKIKQDQFQNNAGAGPGDIFDKQTYNQGGNGFPPVSELPSGPYSRTPGPVHELGGSQK